MSPTALGPARNLAFSDQMEMVDGGQNSVIMSAESGIVAHQSANNGDGSSPYGQQHYKSFGAFSAQTGGKTASGKHISGSIDGEKRLSSGPQNSNSNGG